MIKHTFEEPTIIYSIAINCQRSQLESDSGRVIIEFTFAYPHAQQKDFFDLLEAHRAKEPPAVPSKPGLYCAWVGMEKSARPLIDALYQAGLIQPNDKIALNTILNEGDIHLKHYQEQSNESNTAQTDVINSLIDPYIDHIIEISHTPYDVLALINTALILPITDADLSYHNQKIADLCQAYNIQLNPQELHDLAGSLLALNKFFYDDISSAKTLRNYGNSIPTTTKIKRTILDFLKEKLIKHYPLDQFSKLESFCIQFAFIAFKNKRFVFTMGQEWSNKYHLIEYLLEIFTPARWTARQKLEDNFSTGVNISEKYTQIKSEIDQLLQESEMTFLDIPLNRIAGRLCFHRDTTPTLFSKLPLKAKSKIFGCLTLKDKYALAQTSKDFHNELLIHDKNDEWGMIKMGPKL